MTVGCLVCLHQCGRCPGCTCGCGCVCVRALFPDTLQLEIKQASPLTLVLSLKSLIGLQSLERGLLEHHCTPVFSAVFSPSFGSVGWQAGRKAPAHLLYRPRETQLQAKSVQNVKHRWPLTHKWVHGKRESPVSDSAESSSFFFFLHSASSSSPTPSGFSYFYYPSSHAFTSHTPLPLHLRPFLSLWSPQAPSQG